MKKQTKILIILAMFLVLAVPVFALSLSDLGIGIATDNVASTSVNIYDTYAQLIDFLLFLSLFVAIAHIAFKKWFGEDFKNAGAGNAVRALAVVVGTALAIAALKAGLSVTFFIPFVKNLIFFLVMVVIYFLLQRMGVKSKVFSWILAVIITFLLFYVSDVFFNSNKLGVPSFGKFGGLPDLGGPTKVTKIISGATNSVGDFFSGLFGSSGNKKTQVNNTKDIINSKINETLKIYQRRAIVECNALINLSKDSFEQSLAILKNTNKIYENQYNTRNINSNLVIAGQQSFLAKCRQLEKEFESLLTTGTLPTDQLNLTDEQALIELKNVAFKIRDDCKFIDIKKDDTYSQLMVKLSTELSKKRTIAANAASGELNTNNIQTSLENYDSLISCEEHLTELDKLLIESPKYTDYVVGFEQKAEVTPPQNSTQKTEIPPIVPTPNPKNETKSKTPKENKTTTETSKTTDTKNNTLLYILIGGMVILFGGGGFLFTRKMIAKNAKANAEKVNEVWDEKEQKLTEISNLLSEKQKAVDAIEELLPKEGSETQPNDLIESTKKQYELINQTNDNLIKKIGEAKQGCKNVITWLRNLLKAELEEEKTIDENIELALDIEKLKLELDALTKDNKINEELIKKLASVVNMQIKQLEELEKQINGEIDTNK